MSLPASWVDGLFARLTTRYGEAFLRQYGDLDPAAVKADWADVLDGVSGESIGYALRYLPSEKPPNAMQFRDQCRRAPRPEVAKLPEPRGPIPPEVKQAIAPVVSAMTMARRSAGEQCAERIREIVRERGYITAAQKAQLAALEGGKQ